MASNAKHIAIYNQKSSAGDGEDGGGQSRIIIEIGGNKSGPILSNKEVDMILANANCVNTSTGTVSVVSQNPNPSVALPFTSTATPRPSNSVWPNHPQVINRVDSTPSNVIYNEQNGISTLFVPTGNVARVFTPTSNSSSSPLVHNIPMSGNVKVVFEGNQMKSISTDPMPPGNPGNEMCQQKFRCQFRSSIPSQAQIQMPSCQRTCNNTGHFPFHHTAPNNTQQYQPCCCSQPVNSSPQPQQMSVLPAGGIPCGMAYIPVRMMFNPTTGYEFVPDYSQLRMDRPCEEYNDSNRRPQKQPPNCCCCYESSNDGSEAENYCYHDL